MFFILFCDDNMTWIANVYSIIRREMGLLLVDNEQPYMMQQVKIYFCLNRND